MIDKELNETLSDMRREIEKTIVREVTAVSEKLTSHMTDRFAHNWDHDELRTASIWREQADKRITALEKWRWMAVGGLAVLSAETVFIATIANGAIKHFFGG